MEKYTREQLEKKLKVVNEQNKKDLYEKIQDFNSTKIKKEVYV
jgi:hypothetical protein